MESRCQSGTGAYLCQIINENGSVTSEWEIWILFALEAIRLHPLGYTDINHEIKIIKKIMETVCTCFERRQCLNLESD